MENKINRFKMNWYLISSSKGLTISGVSKTLGTIKHVETGTRSGSMLFKTALAGNYLLLVNTTSPTAIPIFVEAPTRAPEAPANNNLSSRGNLLFNTVEPAPPPGSRIGSHSG